MIGSRTCEEKLSPEVARAYVAATLSADETSRFELHLLRCPSCQDEVRFTAGVAAMARPVARARRWIGGGMLAAAAVLVMAALGTRDARSSPLAPLGATTGPAAFAGMSIRDEAGPADSLFDLAMAAYARRDYRTAERLLRALVERGSPEPPVEFFLAASLLLQNRPADAAEAFTRVIRSGDTPYLPEARYYLAKALLQLGARDGALHELRTLALSGHELAAHADALADSVEAREER